MDRYYYIHWDKLGDTSNEGARRYRTDLQNAIGIPVCLTRTLENTTAMREAYDEIAQQVWDDNIADY